MTNNNINVLGYIRVSTDGQARQGYSLTEQKEAIINYCNSQNYNLIKIFSDEGISGAKADENEMSIERDGILDMLSSLKKQDIQYIIVSSTNRLWRSDLVKVLIHRELKKNNVDVRAIDRPTYSIYTQNPNDILINGMFELLDIYERLEIALKLKRGRLQKAKAGGYAGGGVPYGYCSNGHRELSICADEAKAVRRLFYLKQVFPDFTLQQLSDYMNMEGYKGRNGKGFNPMLVRRILNKENFYKGIYCYSGVNSIGKYEAIFKA